MPEALAQHAMHQQLQPAARPVTSLQLAGLLRRPRRPAVAAALEPSMPSMPETLAVALAHRRLWATRHLQPTIQLARSTRL